MASAAGAPGGYEVEFVKPLKKDLECPICLLALREPLQTPCGHLMCKSCVDKITKDEEFKCPLDNKVEKRSEAFLDKIHERKVLGLKVKCNNHGDGCAWMGELRDLQKHADDGCDFAQVYCEFLSVGCSHKMKKRDVGDHKDKCSKEHLDLLLKNVDDLKAQIQRRPSESCKFIWRIENWSETLENAKMKKTTILYSSAFYTGYPGYKLCMCIQPDYEGEGHVGVYLIIMKGDFDHQLQWPFPYSYRLTVIDQQPDGNNVSVLFDPAEAGADAQECYERKTYQSMIGWGRGKFISHLDLTKEAYIRDDSLLLRAEILI
ncbi:TNF receptor-associated factor 6-like isoform X1 [Corticium candelabrum]|uniref:TNF receptor-associated factor 6-like isoform X1 n=1 Tax=Corticium candelabrum TaxID=121492 RepID=UPI002E25D086|nr:TNF receptor-associated factor 6-like isoform X1 [Corticium candelabrum]